VFRLLSSPRRTWKLSNIYKAKSKSTWLGLFLNTFVTLQWKFSEHVYTRFCVFNQRCLITAIQFDAVTASKRLVIVLCIICIISECACFCVPVSDSFTGSFYLLQSLQVNISDCVVYPVHNVWEYGTMLVYKIVHKALDNGNQNLWSDYKCLVRAGQEIWHSDDRASWYILIIKLTRRTNFSNLFLEWNSTCFEQVFCPSAGVSYCIHNNRYMSYRFCWLLASRIRMELHPDPANKQSAKPVWHIPIAVYTVLDSWWWTENLFETCRVLFQK